MEKIAKLEKENASLSSSNKQLLIQNRSLKDNLEFLESKLKNFEEKNRKPSNFMTSPFSSNISGINVREKINEISQELQSISQIVEYYAPSCSVNMKKQIQELKNTFDHPEPNNFPLSSKNSEIKSFGSQNPLDMEKKNEFSGEIPKKIMAPFDFETIQEKRLLSEIEYLKHEKAVLIEEKQKLKEANKNLESNQEKFLKDNKFLQSQLKNTSCEMESLLQKYMELMEIVERLMRSFDFQAKDQTKQASPMENIETAYKQLYFKEKNKCSLLEKEINDFKKKNSFQRAQTEEFKISEKDKISFTEKIKIQNLLGSLASEQKENDKTSPVKESKKFLSSQSSEQESQPFQRSNDDDKKENNFDYLREEKHKEMAGKLLGEIEHEPSMKVTQKHKRRKREGTNKEEEPVLFDYQDIEVNYINNSDFSEIEEEKQKKEVKQIEKKPEIVSNNKKAFKQSLREKIEKMTIEISPEIQKLNFLLEWQKKGAVGVSPLRHIEEFAHEYQNEKIKAKVLELKKEIPVFRSIKGDGNCFFRAVGFLFLESAMLESFKENQLESLEIFQFLNEFKLIDLVSEDMNNQQLKSIFLQHKDTVFEYFLLKVYELLQMKVVFHSDNNESQDYYENQILQIKKLEMMIKEDLVFDLALVWAMRSRLHEYYTKQKENPIYKDFIYDFEDHLKTLETYGKEAENELVPFMADALGYTITINVLHIDYKKNEEVILKQEYGQKKKDNWRKEICLFFRPGHYDVGYSEDFMMNAYQKITI